MAIYPEAIFRPIVRFNSGGSKSKLRKKGRGTCNHVAAGEAASLFRYFNTSGSPCSHFYVRRSGVVEQYVDTDFVAPANLDGNDTVISIETQGGADDHTADKEPWSDDAVNALIRLHVWLYRIDGFPLQMMPNSLPSSKGIGYHRLGIDPWRIPDGEYWSSAYGKICPGTEKINQLKNRILPGIKAIIEGTDEGLDMGVLDEVLAELKGISAILRTEAVRSDSITNKQLPDVRNDTELIANRLDYLANNALPAIKDSTGNVSTQLNSIATKLQEVIDTINQRMPLNS